ncbi:MAG: phosphohydrolase, partial [Gammaproteobacteria bacterium]|nr:phosphohydrolase [Gammaproteobacteria bacterium]
MSLILPGIVASLCYVTATFMQLRSIVAGAVLNRWIKVLGGFAVIFHAITNYQDFTGAGGIDLGIYPMMSLMALSIVAIVIISSLRRPVDNLFIVI